MRSVPTWPVASSALVLGFLVAVATGVRPLGGLVLLAGAAWCAPRWRQAGSLWPLLGVFLGVFVLSHLAGLVIGTWPAVLGAAALMAAAAWRWCDQASRSDELRATMSL